MYLDRTSSLDLYFFAPLAHEALTRHRIWLGSYLKASLGNTWHDQLSADIKTYRARFETLLRELVESSDVVRERDRLRTQVSTWRSLMTSLARQAPVARRAVLLQAAGHGLGSPRSLKETRELLVELKARMHLHADTFRGLGAADAALSFPARSLEALEHASSSVVRDRAEDGLARSQVYELQRTLIDRFEQLGHAASAAADQGALLDDEDQAERGRDLLLLLQRALAEARMQSRRRAASGEVPADLIVENTTPTAGGEVTTTPLANGLSTPSPVLLPG